MKVPDIGEQLDRIDDTNNLIPLVLGLIGMLDELTRYLDCEASEPTAPGGNEDELSMFALLGLLSVHRSMHRWIDPIDVAPIGSLLKIGRPLPDGKDILR